MISFENVFMIGKQNEGVELKTLETCEIQIAIN